MQKEIIAVAGASADTSKYWYRIFNDIKAYGLEVYCVNPKVQIDKKNNIYNTLNQLPVKPTTLVMVMRPDLAPDLVKQAIKDGVKTIWFQPGAYNEQAAKQAQEAGIEVHNACFMVATGIW